MSARPQDAIIPADAVLLRETAAMGEKLKALLVPYGASPEGWDDWSARLSALADVLERATPAPRYACGYCGTAYTGSVTPPTRAPLVSSPKIVLRAMGTQSWPEAMRRAAALLNIYGGRYGLPPRTPNESAA